MRVVVARKEIRGVCEARIAGGGGIESACEKKKTFPHRPVSVSIRYVRRSRFVKYMALTTIFFPKRVRLDIVFLLFTTPVLW